LAFPDAVPHSFVGSVTLAWLTAPAACLARMCGLLSTKLDLQIIGAPPIYIRTYTRPLMPRPARLTLASLNALALARLRRATARCFGLPASLLFVLLTCTQFYLPFWMGRTMPNMFALAPGTPVCP
jgi:alpha-1,6-mannosyltransferase